jgi:hypothetical protein
MCSETIALWFCSSTKSLQLTFPDVSFRLFDDINGPKFKKLTWPLLFPEKIIEINIIHNNAHHSIWTNLDYRSLLLHLDISYQQELELHLDLSRIQEPVLHLDLSRLQEPVLQLDKLKLHDPGPHLVLYRIQEPVLHLDISKLQEPLLRLDVST